MSTNDKTLKHQAWLDRLRHEIIDSIDQQMLAAFERLPDEYFESVSEDDQLSQLKALMAVKICDIKQEITLRRPDGRQITIIGQENYAGYLAELIRRLPDEGDLVGAKVFSSQDGGLLIDMFEFRPRDEQRLARQLSDQERTLATEVAELAQVDAHEVIEFIGDYRPGHELFRSPSELAQQFLAFQTARASNNLAVIWKALDSPGNTSGPPKQYAQIVVASGTATTRAVFTRAADFFGQYQIDIERAWCENIRIADDQDYSISTFHICVQQEAFEAARGLFDNDCSEILDGDVLRTRLLDFLRAPDEVVVHRAGIGTNLAHYFGDVQTGELFCAFTCLLQNIVTFRFGLELTREQIAYRLLKHEIQLRSLLTHFQSRFTGPTPPALSNGTDLVADSIDQTLLDLLQELVTGIDRCNVACTNRSVLGMRIPGKLAVNPDRGESAYAIFFVFGAGFDGFHLRFRDVARGGMRLVRTRNREHYLFESSRSFDEVYRLASAQHLKNKDIAEGGAKAVVVLRPGTQPDRAGQGFVEGLLDLITGDETVYPAGVDRFEELLYLGPDENVSNNLINWIVNRAAERGYRFPNTIMSSKPTTGINHKQFGVTSEGVTVFLHRALLETGFQPATQPFTVKLTGGPDGDVGGNEIKILIRDYGTNAVIVAIADGTGAAHDPQGLNHQELLRLVDRELGIAHFSPDALGAAGKVADLSTAENVAWRNNLHFSVTSDVFVPAGGRPSAINGANWKSYLDDTGKPRSKIIVEGANLFVTEDAREELSRLGVTIVKDSSANKCGVVCSSLEIISNMLLTEEQFFKIRPQFISETLEILRQLANIEAISLFNEHRRQPRQSLPSISVAISQEIIRVSDAIMEGIESWSDEHMQLANQFILSILPPSLVEQVGTQLAEKIPVAYRAQLIAASLSSRVVYREGCKNVSELGQAALTELIQLQLYYERRVCEMVASVQASDLECKDQIVSILNHAGARSQRELKL